ncbi:peptidoglycan-binding protein [Frankia sp. QA3]|uniref:peptidoglycan-binding protein n=1 Tax=Frankia sp. QA3 TaxID=710111 RepID=UPI000269CD7B|nr:peptidoglycan-binding protein [Frankia sp. QA3]EIV96113.1 membrane-fusion protein [Frankia sp. QA3]
MAGRRAFAVGWAAAVVAAVIALVAALVAGSGPGGSTAAGAGSASAVTTVPAQVRDLARTMTLDGVIAHPDLRDLATPKVGTITGLPQVGDELGSGKVLMRVDDRPVILLAGKIPAWRDLGPGAADGDDVAELEQALLALGHGTPSATFPDRRWGAATTRAVEELQAATGAVVDGVLSLGEVVFVVGDIHIAKVAGHLGGPSGPDQAVMTVSSTARTVLVDLDPLDRDLVVRGAPAQVELPGGERVPGTIQSVTTTLELNADNKQVFKARIALTTPDAGQGLDLAPVTVHYTSVVVKHVLAVPAAAIIGIPGGRYAVQIVDADGTRRRAIVTPGAWGDGYVQVTGAVRAGDQVEVPR